MLRVNLLKCKYFLCFALRSLPCSSIINSSNISSSYIRNPLRLANCTLMHERLLEYPFIRIIPFPYQFGTSGNEIGKAKTQFGKQNCICEMEFQVCQFHFHLCQIDMEKVGMGLFGATDLARPIRRRPIRHWPIRPRDFSAQFQFFTTINEWLE